MGPRGVGGASTLYFVVFVGGGRTPDVPRSSSVWGIN